MMRLARVPVETLCTEVAGDHEQLGLVVDLSESGLRLQRPLRTARRGSPIIQLEFGLPGDDEIVWAKGEICFDQLWRGEGAPVRTSGIRILSAAQRHLRRIADWVVHAREERRLLDQELEAERIRAHAPAGWALRHASHWRG